MNLYLNSPEELHLPILEAVSVISIVTTKPVRKIFTAAWESYQSKRFWTSSLCFMTGAAYILGILALTFWLAPVFKAFLVAKLAFSPPVAQCICWGCSHTVKWGIGKIVRAIGRNASSVRG